MASMTDVVFLLLVFFMVTSTFIFPTAMEVNLPQSSEQTPLKPTTRVYLESSGALYIQYGESAADGDKCGAQVAGQAHENRQNHIACQGLYQTDESGHDIKSASFHACASFL